MSSRSLREFPWDFSKSLFVGVSLDATGPIVPVKDVGKFSFDSFQIPSGSSIGR